MALVLLDPATPVHLAGAHDCADLRDWTAVHTGAPLARVGDAAFAFGIRDTLQPVARSAAGLPDHPDRSATLVVDCDDLRAEGARLSGPGIAGHAVLSLPEIAAFRANSARFPLGFDTVLAAGDRLAGLPRSTIVEAGRCLSR